MLVLMPEHRLTGSFSKIRSPDAHISLADDRDLESAALVGFGAGPAGHRLPEV